MTTPAQRPDAESADLNWSRTVFARVTPWSGAVRDGFAANFLGVMTDLAFLRLNAPTPRRRRRVATGKARR
ncbi:MAG: hypothetical protein EXQ85_09985 [Alphaproteobacteria bacterium]|nr:hypothetical protein [Alphaproteobacteria bacterium]